MTTYAFKGLVGSNWVTDSTALAALAITDDIVPGSRVMNADVGHNFTYTISTAALDPDVVVAVSGRSDARWILDTSDSEVASVTGDFVDNTDPLNPVIDATGAIVSAMFNASAVAPAATTATTATNIADGAVSTAAKIVDDVITNAKLVEVAANTIKSNLTGSTANPADNTLDVIVSAIAIAIGQLRPVLIAYSAIIDLTTTGTYLVIPPIAGRLRVVIAHAWLIETKGGTVSVSPTYSIGTNASSYDNLNASSAGAAGFQSQVANTYVTATTAISPVPALDLSTGLYVKVTGGATGSSPVLTARVIMQYAVMPA